jgi:hypothetical protein
MQTYNVKHLASKGAPIAMAMLLRAVNKSNPFITYLSVAKELEKQFDIPKVFPLHIGNVAGEMMNSILAVYPKAPLINVLICRSNGVPGGGAGDYLTKRYNDPLLHDWSTVPMRNKRELVERERQKILSYPNWDQLVKNVFGRIPPLRIDLSTDKARDYEPGRGGEAESPEHKRLKRWVHDNPNEIGIRQIPTYKEMEQRLLSGDEVDVAFRCGATYYVVEVKSKRSNEADLERGIYQCIKYRAVRCAELGSEKSDVVAILVTEEPLPQNLNRKALELNIKAVCVKVN